MTKEKRLKILQEKLSLYVQHHKKTAKFLVLDTETTGLSDTDEVIQIAIIDDNHKY